MWLRPSASMSLPLGQCPFLGNTDSTIKARKRKRTGRVEPTPAGQSPSASSFLSERLQRGAQDGRPCLKHSHCHFSRPLASPRAAPPGRPLGCPGRRPSVKALPGASRAPWGRGEGPLLPGNSGLPGKGEAPTATGVGSRALSEVNVGWGRCGWFAPGEGEGLGVNRTQARAKSPKPHLRSPCRVSHGSCLSMRPGTAPPTVLGLTPALTPGVPDTRRDGSVAGCDSGP